jgi:hypothetical protein
MKRYLSLGFAVGLLCTIIFSCSRNIALEKTRQSNLEQLEKKIFVLKPDKQLPKDTLHSERIELILSDRILQANWVSAGQTAPAFFILHGNGETVSEWKPLQMYLFSKGYSSFVFDYTGFGNSTGKPTVANLNMDAMEAYKKFASLTPIAKERIGFAHSLGCSILLNDANDFKPLLNKVVIHGAFSTLRNILVDKHFINDSSKANYPNVWNGLKNAQKIKSSLYILHSVNDQTIPIEMSMDLAKSAGSNGRFLKLETPGHNAVYEVPTDKTWNVIFEFIK